MYLLLESLYNHTRLNAGFMSFRIAVLDMNEIGTLLGSL